MNNTFNLIENHYPYYWFKKSEHTTNKEPIVYIHGFGDHPRWLFPIFNKFNDRDIYCIELPGHWATPLNNNNQLKPINMANEIVDLLKELKLDKIILIGHSMGGGIVLMVNSLLPKITDKIIMISPMNSHGVGLKQIYNFVFKFNSRKKNKNFYKLLVSKRYVDQLYKKTISDLENNFKSRKNNYKILIKNLINLSNYKEMKKAEKNIECKTLLILGNNDNIVNSKKTEKYFNKKIKNLKVHIFENVGHMAFYEEKKLFYQLIDKFINDLL